MLNLFKLLPKETKTQSHKKDVIENKSKKHFPSSIREWKNSIYVFNKNSEKLIPSTSNLVSKSIKSYFNLYNKRIEVKMRTKRLLLRLRRLSSNKFYVSNSGFKHTNNKVCINLYVFNRQKKNYILTLKKWFLRNLLSRKTKKNNLEIMKKINIPTVKNRKRKINRFKKIRRIIYNNKKRKVYALKNVIKIARKINNTGREKLELLKHKKNLLENTLNVVKNSEHYKIKDLKSIKQYTENFYKNLIKKSFKKMRMYFYYKQLIYLNKSKLNYTYLQYLKKYLENIYKKNVEFNIINIKKFYLDSDIFSESITKKLARNRRKLLRYLTKLKDKVSLKNKTVLAFTKSKHNLVKRLNLSSNNVQLSKYILSNLKYKHVAGFRLEAKGRLSKRFTASRSVSKLKYKGSLLEFDSSFKGLSSVLLKGNLRPNTQLTKISSKSRIGSFGIKGWISGK